MKSVSHIIVFFGIACVMTMLLGSCASEQTITKTQVRKDAWGNEYQYRAPGQNGDYDLYSLGRDGQEGGDGSDADITNWN